MEKDIRWIQRYDNFSRAFNQLSKFIEKKELNELEEQGLLQSFQYNYELAWNMIKDFYENQGETDIQGSRDAIRLAFKRGLIEDGQIWMDMIKSRILTAHTYNEKTAREVSDDVRNKYYSEFEKLKLKFEKIMDRENSL
jgi:nucleotidyltransferase substrate binding protein (TIGR01987 family)